MARCHLCGALIDWAVVLGSGKKMPLDPFPDAEKGNIAVVQESPRKVVRVLTKDDDRSAIPQLLVPHFVTCPNRGAPIPKGRARRRRS